MPTSHSHADRNTLAVAELRSAWPDTRLVRECLAGNHDAWRALVAKYKNLIFSIPVKFGFSVDDANDIFQSVCLELLSELPNLRRAKALPKWLMQITSHKCIHRKRQMVRIELFDPNAGTLQRSETAEAEDILRQAQQDQNLRQAVTDLPPRCRQMVHMLFFTEPALPYQEIAKCLGLAPGSVGFIRQRCLDRLRTRLKETGF